MEPDRLKKGCRSFHARKRMARGIGRCGHVEINLNDGFALREEG
jgi:hypothetical protein